MQVKLFNIEWDLDQNQDEEYNSGNHKSKPPEKEITLSLNKSFHNEWDLYEEACRIASGKHGWFILNADYEVLNNN